jgi:hypothetical protein
MERFRACLILIILVTACLAGCDVNDIYPHNAENIKVSGTTSSSLQFPCEIKVDTEGDTLIVTVTVENRTSKTVTFVDHADHRSISVFAADRSKDEAINPLLVSYVRATRENLKLVPPGSRIAFAEWFRLRRPSPGVLEVADYNGREDEFMRITDKKLQATFLYGWYPEYLPEESPPKSLSRTRKIRPVVKL